MTNAEGLPPTEDVPEADLAEQWIAADATDDEGLNPAHLENIDEIEANPADVIDQAISVPLPDEDYDIGQ
ncbi:hypothetical protein [Mycolicibacter terrae]|nr:hypothetical protein [Mycolicibacter terrae]ORW93123.1 hypothetical protein AWC28_17025 [Mycolicibacter terrae]SNV87754.1 Uncharacterised protein [Mycolicibacter terrae]